MFTRSALRQVAGTTFRSSKRVVVMSRGTATAPIAYAAHECCTTTLPRTAAPALVTRRFCSTSSEKPKEANAKPTHSDDPKDHPIEDSKHQAEHNPAAHADAATKKVLAEKDEKIKELKSEVLYAMADAQNARKVAAEDVRKAKEFGIKDFAKDMIDVVDCLENAIATLGKLPKEDQEKMKNVGTGISMTLAVFLKNLGRHGVKKIDAAPGNEFDCNVHEALFNHPIKAGETLKPGQISQVMKTGYMITSRVLRATQVGVAQENPDNKS